METYAKVRSRFGSRALETPASAQRPAPTSPTATAASTPYAATSAFCATAAAGAPAGRVCHGGARRAPAETSGGPPGGRGGPAGSRTGGVGCFPGGAPRPLRHAGADGEQLQAAEEKRAGGLDHLHGHGRRKFDENLPATPVGARPGAPAAGGSNPAAGGSPRHGTLSSAGGRGARDQHRPHGSPVAQAPGGGRGQAV